MRYFTTDAYEKTPDSLLRLGGPNRQLLLYDLHRTPLHATVITPLPELGNALRAGRDAKRRA